MALSPHMAALGTVYYSVLRAHPEHRFCATAAEDSALYATLDATRIECSARIHAFCRTPDDLHVLFEVSQRTPEEFIGQLALGYARPVGFKRNSMVPLFRDSYRLASLDCQFLLLQLVCHIHLTPIAAGLTEQLVEYASSSYRAYRGLESIPWLTTQRALSMLDRDPDRGPGNFSTNVSRQASFEPDEVAVPARELWHSERVMQRFSAR